MAPLKHKKHLFFDLDDTLWDMQVNAGAVLAGLFEELDLGARLNCHYPEFFEKYRTINLELWSLMYKKQIKKDQLRERRFKMVLMSFGCSDTGLAEVISARFLKRAPYGKALLPGCIETLIYLQASYSLHIITNGFSEVQPTKLHETGLRPFFKQVLISEEHHLVKPEEKIFRLAEQLADCKKEECVMIGDSYESDISGALNAGWEAIHLNHDSAPVHSNTIRTLSELKNYF